MRGQLPSGGHATDERVRGGGDQGPVVADDELELAVTVDAGVAEVPGHQGSGGVRAEHHDMPPEPAPGVRGAGSGGMSTPSAEIGRASCRERVSTIV